MTINVFLESKWKRILRRKTQGLPPYDINNLKTKTNLNSASRFTAYHAASTFFPGYKTNQLMLYNK
jgi:hypothetical protein